MASEVVSYSEDYLEFFVGISLVLDDIEQRLSVLERIKSRSIGPFVATLTDLCMRDLQEAYTVLHQLSFFEGEATLEDRLPDLRRGERYIRDEIEAVQSYETVPDDLVAQSHRRQLVESTQYLIELGASALSVSRLDLLEGVLRACMLLSVHLSRVQNFTTYASLENSRHYPTRPAWHHQIQLTINRLHTSAASTVQTDLEACHRMLKPAQEGSHPWQYENRWHFDIPVKLFSQARH